MLSQGRVTLDLDSVQKGTPWRTADAVSYPTENTCFSSFIGGTIFGHLAGQTSSGNVGLL